LARTYVRLLGPCFKTGRTGGRRGRRRHRRALVSPTAARTPPDRPAPASRYRRAIGPPPTVRASVLRRRGYVRVCLYSMRARPATRARAGGNRIARRRSPSTRAPRRHSRIGRDAYRREVRRSFAPFRRRARQTFALAETRRALTARLILDGSRRLRPFSSKRFHALLNSLFKVLFNFPSRYLFAIGLVVVFSFRRGLPPA
jgi:hypothetical protein